MAKKRTRAPAARPNVSDSEKAKVFLVWLKKSLPLYKRLSLTIIREVCEYFTSHPLIAKCECYGIIVLDPVLKQKRIQYFNESISSLNYIIPGQCTWIGNDQIFVCGGLTFLVYSVRKSFAMDEHRTVLLRSMKRGRFYHALYYHEDSSKVLAFGGSTSLRRPTNTCEECDLNTTAWSALPNLPKAETHLMACGKREKVFLCGNKYAFFCVFSIATREYAEMEVPVPRIANWYFVVVWKNQLIIFQGYMALRYNVETLELQQAVSCHSMLDRNQSVVVNDSVFVIDNKYKWKAYNLETMETSDKGR